MGDNKEAVRKHEAIIAQTALFQHHINALKQMANSLTYAIIATDDGFPVAHTDMNEKEAIRKAAITASLDGLSSTVAQESSLIKADATHIECAHGFIFSRTIQLDEEKQVVLLMAATREENFATILWHIKNMIEELIKDFNAR